MQKLIMSKLVQLTLVALIFQVSFMGLAQAAETGESPSAVVMVSDLLIARPLLFIATGVGTIFFIASLPFSLLGGNAMDAMDVLVTQPVEATYLRCLGCTYSGRKSKLSK